MMMFGYFLAKTIAISRLPISLFVNDRLTDYNLSDEDKHAVHSSRNKNTVQAGHFVVFRHKYHESTTHLK